LTRFQDLVLPLTKCEPKEIMLGDTAG